MTSPPPYPRTRCRDTEIRQGGFTLLEMLISVSILALIFALMAGGLRFGGAVWERAQRDQADKTDAPIAQNLLRRQLSQILPRVRPDRKREKFLAFDGERDRVRFVGAPPAHLGKPGQYLITISLDGMEKQKRLVMSWRRLAADLSDYSQERPEDSVILADSVSQGWFSYFGEGCRRDIRRWHDTWTDCGSLPELVKIALTLDQESPFAWPDLVIATKI